MKRHKHSLSHYRLLTCDMGQLIPVGVVEVLPGDTFQHRSSALIRCSPLIAPVMHPVQVRLHHFFVPNRLVWDGWEKFITGGDGTEAIPEYPTITLDATAAGELPDYFGIPPVENLEVSALPFRAYNLIFNEMYRDQDLVQEVPEDDTKLKLCSWEKDYFTTSRPWTQKGPDVSVPLGTRAPVYGIGISAGAPADITNTPFKDAAAGDTTYAFGQSTVSNVGVAMAGSGSATDPPDVYADLAQATGGNINDFRRAFAIQRYQEARARYGSRYTEYLQYLGIRPSDARLQRPEYLGGGKQTIQFSEVLSTADTVQTDSGSELGRLGGHGIAAMRSRRYRRFFEEHGHVISIMSVRPKAMYTQNAARKWLRRTKEDYYQKELETIGQQEVYNNEIYATADQSGMETFGYSDRYREYREEQSSVSAEFRDILNYWHLARDFGSPPTLNQAFIDCQPSKRIFAEQTQDSLWCMVNHSIQARRMVNRTAHASLS